MNPIIESAFHTETDLYCGADTDCTDQKPLYDVVLTEHDLLSIFQDHAQRSVYVREGMLSALKELNAEAAKIWMAHISPTLGKPATVPVGLLAADARTLQQAARALYTPPPVHLRLQPSDAHVLKRIWQRLGGFTTRFRITTGPKGATYIVLRGYAGLRSGALVGTRFLATNPRILNLGIGVNGIRHIARSSASLAIVVSTAVELGDWYFRDDATLGDLVGGIAVEVVKAGVSIAMGVLAGTIAAGTTIAVLPVVGFVLVSFGVGWALNWVDSAFGIKKMVQEGLNSLPAKLEGLPPGWYRLDEGALERLHGVKAEYEAAIQRLKQDASRKASDMATQATAAALAVALQAIERKALQQLQQLLGPRLR